MAFATPSVEHWLENYKKESILEVYDFKKEWKYIKEWKAVQW